MKTLHKLLTLAFLLIAVTACKDETLTPPCKLSTIDRGNGNKHTYTYDANGIITKRGFTDLQGNKYFEVVIKPVGLVKSAEQLLINNGLPFDVLSGFSWQVADGNVGTVYESFFADNDGKLVSDGKEKITALKTNSQGYLIENTTTNDVNKSYTQLFTLVDCD
jgi:YD repeat-containing protein